jgi:hypothetical protein
MGSTASFIKRYYSKLDSAVIESKKRSIPYCVCHYGQLIMISKHDPECLMESFTVGLVCSA